MSKVSITVVIPHFNRPEYLERALGSVAGQSREGCSLDIIIVDDGSNEDSKAALRAIVARQSVPFRISVEWLPANRGGGGARNHGIRTATGEYVAFLDSDDEWLPDKLRIQIPFMLQGAIDFCAAQFVEVFPDGRLLQLPQASFTGDVGNYLFAHGGHFQTSTLIVKANVAKDVLFDESLKKFQDWNFAIRLEAGHHRGAVLMRPLANYYSNHGGRISSQVSAHYAAYFFDRSRHMLSDSARFSFSSRILPSVLLADGQVLAAFRAQLHAFRSHKRLSARSMLSLAKQAASRPTGHRSR